MKAVGFTEHDHDRCIVERIAAVERHCAENRLQFTAVRRRVLEILLDEHKALGAYEILQRLSEESYGSQPPVAYRTLDFLVKHGFAHKIERLSAYVACDSPCTPHFPAFMICRVCDAVAESTSAPAKGVLGAVAREAGFRIEQTVVEAIGTCPICLSKEATH